MHAWRTVCQRGPAVGDRRQRLIVDFDECSGIFGDISAVGDDDRHRLADVNHLVTGQCGTVAVLPVALAGKADDQPLSPQVREQIGQREYSVYARVRERHCLVDAADRGMAVRAAHEGRVQHVGQSDVVYEAPGSSQQIGVFEPANALPYDPAGHGQRPFPDRRRFAASSAAATMPW
jgi:hypothetical protein